MKRTLLSLLILLLNLLSLKPVHAFCGFYVAKADTKLFNKASQVAIARDDDKTVMTMANDFKGDLNEFAIVIPVPTFIEKDQIHIADKALLEHLDAYSAPRLVEYFDENPCAPRIMYEMAKPTAQMAAGRAEDRAKSLGVKIEAQYTIGEYDILILSAKESGGLETWLQENGYKIPKGAGPILASYINQKMRFFVAKVNLKEQSKLGFTYLRPIQVAYESPKFMLPIRLGMVNADGPQELFVYAITRKGRVETTNYRTVKLPVGMDIPIYVKEEFGNFYKALFSEQVKKESMRTVFTEYAWDMNWCDPCAADPLSHEELRQLGVFWLEDENPQPLKTIRSPFPAPGAKPANPKKTGTIRFPFPAPRGTEVFLTRLHLRYDLEHFPEDLVFQQTADRENFQGRYVLRHPWTGKESCPAANDYRRELVKRHEQEAQNLATLTGWNIGEIRKKMNLGPKKDDKKWYQKLWE
jgi:hypothetical protein